MAVDPQPRAPSRSTLSLLVEAVVLVGASLLAYVWLIPAQTSAGGLGLSPAVLPKFCVAVIGLLIAGDVASRFVQGLPQPTYSEGWSAFFRLAAAVALAALALKLGGTIAAVAVCCVATALALDERRLPYLILPALLCAAAFWLVFR